MISNNEEPVNPFPAELLRELTTTLQNAAKTSTDPLYAAFDADGTLWDTDVGEAFFDYQIHHCGLSHLPEDPWRHYRDLKTVDPTLAYVWLAQINQGRRLEEVRSWASQCIDRMRPFPIFSSQLELLEVLRSLGYEIFVVTASVKWAVEPAARLVGIDQDHVLGITTAVERDIVTATAVHPITWRQGKADALLQATGGVRPVFSAGNTFGDSALLSSATHAQLALSTQSRSGTGLFEEERKLRVEARARGWHTHAFREIPDDT